VEVALDRPFFPWDQNRCDKADGWSEGHEEQKVIQPNRQSEHE
jgi:hypothetical protein